MRAISRSISYFKFTCGPKVELFSDLSLVVFLVFLIFYLHVAVCGNEGSDGKFQSSLHLVFKKNGDKSRLIQHYFNQHWLIINQC